MNRPVDEESVHLGGLHGRQLSERVRCALLGRRRQAIRARENQRESASDPGIGILAGGGSIWITTSLSEGNRVISRSLTTCEVR